MSRISPIRLVYACDYKKHHHFTGQTRNQASVRADLPKWYDFERFFPLPGDLPPPVVRRLTSSLPKILTIRLALGPRGAQKVCRSIALWRSLRRLSLLRVGLRMRVET